MNVNCLKYVKESGQDKTCKQMSKAYKIYSDTCKQMLEQQILTGCTEAFLVFVSSGLGSPAICPTKRCFQWVRKLLNVGEIAPILTTVGFVSSKPPVVKERPR